jgi:hypothetical protein
MQSIRTLTLAAIVAVILGLLATTVAAAEEQIASRPMTVQTTDNSQSAPQALPSSALFVSPAGSDSNPGSEAAPFRTITHAMKQLRPGMTLIVRGGTYTERVVLRGSALTPGTPEARITVRNYPGERPVVQGLLWLSNASYWTLDGINVTWDAATGNREEHMMRFYGGEGMIYQNSELWGARSYAAILVTGGATNWNLNHLYVHDTIASNGENQDHLIYIAGATNGVIEHNLLVNASNGRGIKLGQHVDGTSLPANVIVRYNTIVNSNAGNVSLSYDARDNQVYGNVLVNAGKGYANVGAYKLHGANNVARGNITWLGEAGAVKKGTPVVDGGNLVLDPMLDEAFRPTNPALYGADGTIAYGHLAGQP